MPPIPTSSTPGGTYYAFTTGTPLGNHLQALIDTTGNPASGWRSYTGRLRVDALAAHPGMGDSRIPRRRPGSSSTAATGSCSTTPRSIPHPADSGQQLPLGGHRRLADPEPPGVHRHLGRAPRTAGAGGVLDPSPFVDPATGAAYLLWKSNDGSSAAAVPGLVGAARRRRDDASPARPPSCSPWTRPTSRGRPPSTTPRWCRAGGTYDLLFSAGDFLSASYAQALTTCSGPLGPVRPAGAGPFLTSYGSVAGPGGGRCSQDAAGQLVARPTPAGPAPCTNYSCGGVRRLFVAPIDLSNDLDVPCTPPPGARRLPAGCASDGGIFNFGNLPFCGSTGAIHLNQPVVGMAATADGGGYWTVASDGGIFAFGDAGFYGSTGAIHLNQPVVGMAATPDGQGYWLVAADGGIFAFGDAAFYGSTGAIHLNQPIVGHGRHPRRQGLLAGGVRRRHLRLRRRRLLRLDRGHPPQPAHRGHGRRPRTASGYWLVAADGGIFAFGDAALLRLDRGHPPQPAHRRHGRHRGGQGYWLVAADGGIFAFGDARFYGSTGAIHLNQPVVGMSAS